MSIAGNSILRLGLTATAANLTPSAVPVRGGDGIQVTGNELSDIGPAEVFFGTVIGILAQSPIGDVIVGGNRIRRDSHVRAADGSVWFGVVIYGAQAQLAEAVQAQGTQPAELMRSPAALRSGQ